MAKQERRSERIRTRVKARVTTAGDDKPLTGFTRDVSKESLFIQTRVPLPRGTPIEIELHYPDERVDLRGLVVRAERVPVQLQGSIKGGMAVKVRPTAAMARVAGSPRNPRIPLDSNVVVFSGSDRHRLKLHDLSATGAALLAEEDLPDLAFVRMHFKLSSGTEVIEVEGMPVGTRPYGNQSLIAINFIDPPAEFATRIESLIDARGDSEEE